MSSRNIAVSRCSLLVLAAVAVAVPWLSTAQAARQRAPRETRAMWVVRTDITSPDRVTRAMESAKANHLNTVFVQVRGRADAYYRSDLEPRATALAGQRADFDPLRTAVREGHDRGLKVHAWLNAMYVWGENKLPRDPKHLVNAHPEWLCTTADGKRVKTGSEVFVCPGNRAARQHLAAVAADVARRYNVDGVQLDYIRYAGPQFCYCDGCLTAFRQRLGGEVSAAHAARARKLGRVGLCRVFPEEWQRFRRDQVTACVEAVREAVKGVRPRIVLSTAVISWGSYPGDFRRTEAYTQVAQDWFGWMDDGLVDVVCPMTYQTAVPAYRAWVDAVKREHPSFPVWFGVGAWLFGPEGAAEKIRIARQGGASGWSLFSYSAVSKGGTDDAYLRTLKSRVAPEWTPPQEARELVSQRSRVARQR